jgi:hypothetical protein
VNAIHFNQHSDNYLPYPEAQDFLNSLKENGYHITIASHRSPDYRRQTEKWLKKHGLVHDELHLSYDKTVLIDDNCHIVVDDAPQILENAAAKGVTAAGLMFPWNKNFRNNGYKLCTNLDEILRHILNGTKKI